MHLLKRMVSPIYEAYRHLADVRKSAKLYNIDELIELIMTKSTNNKKKIRFSHYSESTWNTIRSVVESFLEEDSCDVLVVLARNDENMRRQVIESGARYILFGDYDIKLDSPDVLLISHTRDDLFKKEDRLYVNYVVVLSIALIHYFDSIEEFISVVKGSYGDLNPNYHIYDKLMYTELKKKGVYGDKLVCMGNPKYDGIFESMNSEYSNPLWMKMSGKKVILYAPDHGVQYGYIAEDFSFEIYARQIFEYFVINKEVGLIFRPHKTFIEEMLIHKYWTRESIDKFRNIINSTENIIWDDNDTYDGAYSICDAIITDCHCGIVCSALPTNKPIGVLYKNHDIAPISEKLTLCQYEIYTNEDLYAFLDNVRNGFDPKLKLRKEINKECVCNFDGMNGRRIRDYILEKINND